MKPLLSRGPYRWTAMIAALVVAGITPGFLSTYQGFVVAFIAINLIACLGLNVLVGYSGQLSLAQASFMGVGAYTYAICVARFHWPAGVALLAALVGAALLGAVLAIPAARLSGFYLALVTLGFQYIFVNVITSYASVTGGSSGLSVPPVALNGTILPKLTLERTILISTVIVLIMVWNTRHSHFGRTLIALRDNENAATSVGVHLATYKIYAFIMSSTIAGFAGALLAVYIGFADPGQFSINVSIQIIIVTFIAGVERLAGVVFAAVLVFGSTQYLSGIDQYRDAVFNILLLVFVIFAPQGISGVVDQFRRAWRRRSDKTAPPDTPNLRGPFPNSLSPDRMLSPGETP